MKPEISVLLSVYNEDKHLKKCLDSLVGQKGVRYEVVVVDDGSNKNVKCQMSNVKCQVFRIGHSGTAKARNFGAQRARGKILVFLDADMEFEPDFLKKLTSPIHQGKAKGTFSTQELVANWENVWARCLNWENGLPDKRRINPDRIDMVKDFRAILKSEFERVGGFDDIGYTDTWTLAEKLHYHPFPVTNAVYYHFNPESLLEVYRQAIWIGGRKRRLGLFGKILALLRVTLPFSFLLGTLKAVQHLEPRFVIFKVVYDIGILTGVTASLFET